MHKKARATLVSHPPWTWLRLRLSEESFGGLLLLWFAVYLACGALFSILYSLLDCLTVQDPAVLGPFSALYFSLLTQGAMGFGDAVPATAAGKGLALAQSFLGTLLNALLLGIAVFKVFKPASPIVFPEHLVYEREEHRFWFRFVNTDPDTLREVRLHVYLLTPLNYEADRKRGSYDTITSKVRLPFDYWPTRDPRNLTAVRTLPNKGKWKNDKPLKDFGRIILTPGHCVETNPDFPPYLSVEVSGHFRATGDIFFATKEYSVDEIRCGRYADVNNNELSMMELPVQLTEINNKLNLIHSSTASECTACPFHPICVFDVARATREAAARASVTAS